MRHEKQRNLGLAEAVEKLHYKMYKDGKHWVFAGISLLFGASIIGAGQVSAHADTSTNASSGDTTSVANGESGSLVNQNSVTLSNTATSGSNSESTVTSKVDGNASTTQANVSQTTSESKSTDASQSSSQTGSNASQTGSVTNSTQGSSQQESITSNSDSQAKSATEADSTSTNSQNQDSSKVTPTSEGTSTSEANSVTTSSMTTSQASKTSTATSVSTATSSADQTVVKAGAVLPTGTTVTSDAAGKVTVDLPAGVQNTLKPSDFTATQVEVTQKDDTSTGTAGVDLTPDQVLATYNATLIQTLKGRGLTDDNIRAFATLGLTSTEMDNIQKTGANEDQMRKLLKTLQSVQVKIPTLADTTGLVGQKNWNDGWNDAGSDMSSTSISDWNNIYSNPAAWTNSNFNDTKTVGGYTGWLVGNIGGTQVDKTTYDAGYHNRIERDAQEYARWINHVIQEFQISSMAMNIYTYDKNNGTENAGAHAIAQFVMDFAKSTDDYPGVLNSSFINQAGTVGAIMSKLTDSYNQNFSSVFAYNVADGYKAVDDNRDVQSDVGNHMLGGQGVTANLGLRNAINAIVYIAQNYIQYSAYKTFLTMSGTVSLPTTLIDLMNQVPLYKSVSWLGNPAGIFGDPNTGMPNMIYQSLKTGIVAALVGEYQMGQQDAAAKITTMLQDGTFTINNSNGINLYNAWANGSGSGQLNNGVNFLQIGAPGEALDLATNAGFNMLAAEAPFYQALGYDDARNGIVNTDIIASAEAQRANNGGTNNADLLNGKNETDPFKLAQAASAKALLLSFYNSAYNGVQQAISDFKKDPMHEGKAPVTTFTAWPQGQNEAPLVYTSPTYQQTWDALTKASAALIKAGYTAVDTKAQALTLADDSIPTLTETPAGKVADQSVISGLPSALGAVVKDAYRYAYNAEAKAVNKAFTAGQSAIVAEANDASNIGKFYSTGKAALTDLSSDTTTTITDKASSLTNKKDGTMLGTIFTEAYTLKYNTVTKVSVTLTPKTSGDETFATQSTGVQHPDQYDFAGTTTHVITAPSVSGYTATPLTQSFTDGWPTTDGNVTFTYDKASTDVTVSFVDQNGQPVTVASLDGTGTGVTSYDVPGLKDVSFKEQFEKLQSQGSFSVIKSADGTKLYRIDGQAFSKVQDFTLGDTGTNKVTLVLDQQNSLILSFTNKGNNVAVSPAAIYSGWDDTQKGSVSKQLTLVNQGDDSYIAHGFAVQTGEIKDEYTVTVAMPSGYELDASATLPTGVTYNQNDHEFTITGNFDQSSLAKIPLIRTRQVTLHFVDQNGNSLAGVKDVPLTVGEGQLNVWGTNDNGAHTQDERDYIVPSLTNYSAQNSTVQITGNQSVNVVYTADTKSVNVTFKTADGTTVGTGTLNGSYGDAFPTDEATWATGLSATMPNDSLSLTFKDISGKTIDWTKNVPYRLVKKQTMPNGAFGTTPDVTLTVEAPIAETLSVVDQYGESVVKYGAQPSIPKTAFTGLGLDSTHAQDGVIFAYGYAGDTYDLSGVTIDALPDQGSLKAVQYTRDPDDKQPNPLTGNLTNNGLIKLTFTRSQVLAVKIVHADGSVEIDTPISVYTSKTGDFKTPGAYTVEYRQNNGLVVQPDGSYNFLPVSLVKGTWTAGTIGLTSEADISEYKMATVLTAASKILSKGTYSSTDNSNAHAGNPEGYAMTPDLKETSLPDHVIVLTYMVDPTQTGIVDALKTVYQVSETTAEKVLQAINDAIGTGDVGKTSTASGASSTNVSEQASLATSAQTVASTNASEATSLVSQASDDVKSGEGLLASNAVGSAGMNAAAVASAAQEAGANLDGVFKAEAQNTLADVNSAVAADSSNSNVSAALASAQSANSAVLSAASEAGNQSSLAVSDVAVAQSAYLAVGDFNASAQSAATAGNSTAASQFNSQAVSAGIVALKAVASAESAATAAGVAIDAGVKAVKDAQAADSAARLVTDNKEDITVVATNVIGSTGFTYTVNGGTAQKGTYTKDANGRITGQIHAFNTDFIALTPDDQALYSVNKPAQLVVSKTAAANEIQVSYSSIFSTEGLQSVMNLADKLKTDNYSTFTVKALSDAKTAANKALEEAKGASQTATDAEITKIKSDVSSATSGLTDAIAGLVSVQSLKVAINNAGNYSASDYTTESWATLSSALTVGNAALDSTKLVDQDTIDADTTTINNAVKSLVLNANVESQLSSISTNVNKANADWSSLVANPGDSNTSSLASSLVVDLNNYKSQLSSLGNNSQATVSQKSSIGSDITSLTSEINSINSSISGSENSSLTGSIASSIAAGNLQSELTSLSSAITSVNTSVGTDPTKENSSLESSLKSAYSEMSSLAGNSSLGLDPSSLVPVNSNLSSLSSQIESLTTKLSSESSQSSQTSSESRSIVNSVIASINTGTNSSVDPSSVQSSLSSVKSVLSSLKSNSSLTPTQQSSISSLETKVDSQSSSLSSEQSSINESSLIKSIASSIAAGNLQSELTSLSSAITSVNTSVGTDPTKENSSLESSLKSAYSEMSSLAGNSSLGLDPSSLVPVNSNLSSLSSQIESLTTKLSSESSQSSQTSSESRSIVNSVIASINTGTNSSVDPSSVQSSLSSVKSVLSSLKSNSSLTPTQQSSISSLETKVDSQSSSLSSEQSSINESSLIKSIASSIVSSLENSNTSQASQTGSSSSQMSNSNVTSNQTSNNSSTADSLTSENVVAPNGNGGQSGSSVAPTQIPAMITVSYYAMKPDGTQTRVKIAPDFILRGYVGGHYDIPGAYLPEFVLRSWIGDPIFGPEDEIGKGSTIYVFYTSKKEMADYEAAQARKGQDGNTTSVGSTNSNGGFTQNAESSKSNLSKTSSQENGSNNGGQSVTKNANGVALTGSIHGHGSNGITEVDSAASATATPLTNATGESAQTVTLPNEAQAGQNNGKTAIEGSSVSETTDHSGEKLPNTDQSDESGLIGLGLTILGGTFVLAGIKKRRRD
ncbi:KxYKxGKxW signal peptide domain-containing protein [Furfurilactobacillus milii]|uniref:LPXTG cell wall anchor domain-containing protein n=1 Tax=Furfurilactobacillus milii TaxID=2888272 RepID=A0A6N9I635_9LACO|nr:KxYKxGKxW signal peptide domain-containing protein [Furfurilactobacillus milii]MYV17733.1 LPXTG cell wall anchor domain-containing protein [Furfurilactobacillus milii]